MNLIKHKIKDKSAQALPEFALCMPIIVLLIGVIITVCQLVYARQVTQSASFAACKAYVVTQGTDGERQDEAIRHAKAIYEYADMSVVYKTISTKTTPLPVTTSSKRVTGYYYTEVTVTGNINTLFPVNWNGSRVNANNSDVTGYCAMVREDKK